MNRLRIAVVGKGGSGKSTVSGTTARLLGRRGLPVLALDSDPMPGLSISLGLGMIDDAMLNDAAERGDDGRWQLKAGIGPARAVKLFALDAPDGVRFLQFGKATPQGLREIFPSVNAFGHMVRRLARDRVMTGWSVIGDLAAGTRQTAFDWAPYAEIYLVVCEPSWASVLTARRLISLALKHRPDRILIVANKVENRDDVDWIASRIGSEPDLSLPADRAVTDADRRGMALLDFSPASPVVVSLGRLIDELLEGPRRDPDRSG